VRIVGECLRASVDGPYFEDWEFHTLFGLGHLAGYPHGESLAPFTTATVNQLLEILERWRV
jgi:hypothetical protein